MHSRRISRSRSNRKTEMVFPSKYCGLDLLFGPIKSATVRSLIHCFCNDSVRKSTATLGAPGGEEREVGVRVGDLGRYAQATG